jgi:NADPH2:quinone reductase
MPFILRGISLIGVSSSNCPLPWRIPIWERLATDLRPRHLDKIVAETVTLEQLNEVFAAMLAGKIQGRIVVQVKPGI